MMKHTTALAFVLSYISAATALPAPQDDYLQTNDVTLYASSIIITTTLTVSAIGQPGPSTFTETYTKGINPTGTTTTVVTLPSVVTTQ